MSYHQWLQLSQAVNETINRKRNDLTNSANVFAEQLFEGYLAIFSNHCLEQYGLKKALSPKFIHAINLFYLPIQSASDNSGQYLVLEMHGGPEYAAIVTDKDGNTRIFDNRQDAETEATDCQQGLIVEI